MRNRSAASPVLYDVPTDFRDGRTYPRRGREPSGTALWLLRMSDKARAAAAGTIHDYIYPCPMDRGVMQRWGVTADEFEDAIAAHPTDEAITAWLARRATPEDIEAANRWLIDEQSRSLDRQDAEEGTGAAA
jgi:uncharacterized protein DUF5069